MIFRDYTVIQYFNIILLTVLGCIFIYLLLLDALTRYLEKRKKHYFDVWDDELLNGLEKGSLIKASSGLRYDWLVEFVMRYYTSFRGDFLKIVDRICLEKGLIGKMERNILSRRSTTELTALRFFVIAGIIPSEKIRLRLTSAIGPVINIAGTLKMRLIARAWPDLYAIPIIRSINSTDFIGINMRMEIAREMIFYLRANIDDIFAACHNHEPSRLFLIEAAGHFRIKEALPILRECFLNGTDEERIKSMRALGELDSKDMKNAILNAFYAEKRPVIQTLVFKSFLRMASDDDIPIIAVELANANWFIRYAAAKKLVRMGSTGRSILLIERVRDVCELTLAEQGDSSNYQGNNP